MRALIILLFAGFLAIGLSQSSPARAQTFTSTVWQFDGLSTDASFSPPGLYTIAFLPDGTVDIVADCNRASGRWSADASPGQIDITITLQSVKGCPGSAFEADYLDRLDAVDKYSLTDEILSLTSSQGTMTFRSAAA